MSQRPGIAFIATRSFCRDPAGPFLSLVRDYSETIRRFEVHATSGTALAMLSTGEFRCDDETQNGYHVKAEVDIRLYPPGRHGGVVRIAALLPMNRCEVVFFFNDPTDPSADVPENRALERLCKELGVRLVSTFGGARQWFEYEAESVISDFLDSRARSKAAALWEQGISNVDPETGDPINLPLRDQTLALIAHDRRKEDMFLFVNQYGELLQRYGRVLTTGTTGFTLKLVFASKKQVTSVLKEAFATLGKDRFADFLEGAAKVVARYGKSQGRAGKSLEFLRAWAESSPRSASLDGEKLLELIRAWVDDDMPRTAETPAPVLEKGRLRSHPQLAGKILPVPSGPKGGDVILANEVLSHTCHAAVFFQDPQRAHAHDPDIRLFERACHFWPVEEPRNRVHVTCVSDPLSAVKWARSLASVEAGASLRRSGPEEVCRRQDWSLQDVVLIDHFLEASDASGIGRALAEAGARYLLQSLRKLLDEKEIVTVGVGHGQTVERLVEMVEELKQQGCFALDPQRLNQVTVLPLTGTVSGYPLPRQATTIANHLARILGGSKETFLSPGLIEPGDVEKIPDEDRRLIERIEQADLIVVAAGLYDGAIKEAHPVEGRKGNRAPVGIVSSNVIDRSGSAMERVRVPVGIRLEGLKVAAKRGAVMTLCAGSQEDRRWLLRCLLAGHLVSVLVTDSDTVDWLLAPPAQ